jgi:hypothetical protein
MHRVPFSRRGCVSYFIGLLSFVERGRIAFWGKEERKVRGAGLRGINRLSFQQQGMQAGQAFDFGEGSGKTLHGLSFVVLPADRPQLPLQKSSGQGCLLQFRTITCITSKMGTPGSYGWYHHACVTTERRGATLFVLMHDQAETVGDLIGRATA